MPTLIIHALLLAGLVLGSVTSAAAPAELHDGPASRTLVPAVAHTPGAEGSTWRTDLTLHNPGHATAAAELHFLSGDGAPSAGNGVTVTVPAGTSTFLADAVLMLFGLTDSVGALLIDADAALLATSRTFDLGPGGTYGQLVPGLDLTELVMNGPRYLLGLCENSSYRTNLGLVSATAEPMNVTISFLTSHGELLGSIAEDLPAWGMIQVNRPLRTFGDSVDEAWALVSAPAGSRLSAWASVIDNRSQDPVFLPAQAPSAEPRWIAAAAHADGVNATTWRTDLVVANPGPGRATYVVEAMPADTDTMVSATFDLAPGEARRHDDVLAAELDLDGVSAVRVTPEQGAIVATSRTYNDAADGTFGQRVPALPGSGAATSPVRLLHLASAADPNRGFRTNLGVANPGPSALRVSATVHDADGDVIQTLVLEAPPLSQVQRPLFADLAPVDREGVFAVVSPTVAEAPFFAYASVVDNRTGDPIYVPAADPEALAPPLEAAFTVTPASPAAGETATFEDRSTGHPESWRWEFGDGSSAEGATATHTFSAAGTFPVTLTVTRGAEEASATVAVTVAEPPWFSPCATVDLDWAQVASWALDADGDGLDDLLVTSNRASQDSVVVLSNDGGPGFTETFRAEVPGAGPSQAVVADLDGDGRLDFAVAVGDDGSSPPGVVAFRNLGDGGFAGHPMGAPLHDPLELTAADVDGDGDLDLVAADFDIGYTLFANLGGFTFAEDRTGDICEYLAFGDLDGDATVDKVCADVTELAITLDVFGAPVPVPAVTLTGGTFRAVRVRDLDGDGRATILAAVFVDAGGGQSGRLDLFEVVDGDVVPTWSSPVYPGYPAGTQVCDVDGDGARDLLFSCGGVHALVADDGAFTPAGTVTERVLYDRFVCTDLDRDGDVDLATGCRCDLEILCQ